MARRHVLLGGGLVLLSLLIGCAAAPSPTDTPRAATAGARQPTDRAPSPTRGAATPEEAATAPATPTLAPTATSTAVPVHEEESTVTFTVVYDNNACSAGPDTLKTSWGFACWVETGDMTVLFDTGGDGATLMHNLATLGLDPLEIDAVVLSHAHGDHTGGLSTLLESGVRPTVYVPASFPRSFRDDVRASTDVVEVTDVATVGPAIHTTGQMGTTIVEQALVVETHEGLVVVNGCAHPGVVSMVRRARELSESQIALVMGGFHLGGANSREIEGVIAELQGLSVERVAPCHCTGDRARRMFFEAFGDGCALAGVGWSTDFALAADR